MYEELGKLSWLWMSSPLHCHWPVQLQAQFLLQPIQLKQYVLIERANMPVAYCSWAYLDAKAEAQYMLDPSIIALPDWNCGDRLWFVDWIAPFSKHDNWALKHVLAEKFPNHVARAIRVKDNNKKTARVMEFKGTQVNSAIAQKLLATYYSDFLSGITGKQASVLKRLQ